MVPTIGVTTSSYDIPHNSVAAIHRSPISCVCFCGKLGRIYKVEVQVAGCAGATTAGLRGGALDAYIFFGGENGRDLS